MWVPKWYFEAQARKMDALEKRVSALEKREQERINKENYINEHSAKALEEARQLLGFGRA